MSRRYAISNADIIVVILEILAFSILLWISVYQVQGTEYACKYRVIIFFLAKIYKFDGVVLDVYYGLQMIVATGETDL